MTCLSRICLGAGFLLFCLLPGCQKKPRVSAEVVYREYIVETAHAMCEHLLYCFEPFTRALSPAMQKEVTVDQCVNSATADLDAKLARMTPELELLSRECYTALLEAPCNEFGLVAYWNFSCIRIRSEIDRMIFQAR